MGTSERSPDPHWARLCLTIPKRAMDLQESSHTQQLANQADDPESEEVDCQLLVAGAQTATLFLPADRPLHNVPLAVGLLVEVLLTRLVLAGGDDVLHLTPLQPATQPWVAVALVPRHL